MLIANNGNILVTKGLQIAKRLYTQLKDGGIGLFELKSFLTALQSTWVRRGFNSTTVNMGKEGF